MIFFGSANVVSLSDALRPDGLMHDLKIEMRDMIVAGDAHVVVNNEVEEDRYFSTVYIQPCNVPSKKS